jgi:hypothetical protein
VGRVEIRSQSDILNRWLDIPDVSDIADVGDTLDVVSLHLRTQAQRERAASRRSYASEGGSRRSARPPALNLLNGFY